jgi:hypothetical protein
MMAEENLISLPAAVFLNTLLPISELPADFSSMSAPGSILLDNL